MTRAGLRFRQSRETGSAPPFQQESAYGLVLGRSLAEDPDAAHTHEVEEVFFVLQGHLAVFVEDESGRRLSKTLGPWECISCPPGVIHGYQNESKEPVYFQVMLGRARPETMGYADDSLYQRRDAHLKM